MEQILEYVQCIKELSGKIGDTMSLDRATGAGTVWRP